MTRSRRRFSSLAAAGLAGALLFGAGPTPASAGFFDQLFGGGAPQPAPEAPPSYVPEQPFAPLPGRPHVAQPRKKIVRESVPVRQKPTTLMADRTLRPGDAIMMKDGIHIYDGPRTTHHTPGQFVPIEEADGLPKTERSALLAMDLTRNDPLKRTLEPDTLASGRSASETQPLSRGYRITDARGASVRYVGP